MLIFHKVISLFYYKRASWNIVTRAKKYPNSPLPDLDFLMLDFETCVLQNFEECDFTQNVHTDNHKSQMAQFCGHEKVSILIILFLNRHQTVLTVSSSENGIRFIRGQA